MNLLREVAGELLKMFVGDAWLAVGILTVVSLTALLTGSGAVRPLFGGAILFLGCVVVLVASVALAGRRQRDR
jgi:uncharacterized membrane protein YhaH (DUF805 family)